jgi:hypothetical protein
MNGYMHIVGSDTIRCNCYEHFNKLGRFVLNPDIPRRDTIVIYHRLTIFVQSIFVRLYEKRKGRSLSLINDEVPSYICLSLKMGLVSLLLVTSIVWNLAFLSSTSTK